MQSVDYPVIGFRAWYFRENRLTSIVQSWHWRPGTNDAECMRPIHLHRDPAPSENCECGLYAFHDFNLAERYDNRDGVVGIVRGWGQLQIHREGWRSQHAGVLAIIEPRDDANAQRRAQRVAERFQVPLLHADSMPGLAMEFGKLVPEELRPESSVFAGTRGMAPSEEIASLLYVLLPVLIGLAAIGAAVEWVYRRLVK